MAKIRGILETALPVAEMSTAVSFYRRLFELEIMLESERLVALNVAGKQVLLLFLKGATEADFETPGGVIPGHGASGRSHLAFSIDASEFDPWLQRLVELGIAVESTVTWPGGARSIYFRDPDEHLLELITPGFWAVY